MQLFGFWTEPDRKLFRMLISVSGVGPRVALAVISSVPVDEFVHAVANDNLSTLTNVPGIGKKTAQRLMVELKDKLIQGVDFSSVPVSIHKKEPFEEAVLALVSLGYRQHEAQKMVEKVARLEGELPSVERLIKKALQTAVSST